MSRLWSRLCSVCQRTRDTRRRWLAVRAPASSSPRPARSSRRRGPSRAFARAGAVNGVSPQVYSIMARDGAWHGPHMAQPGKALDVLVATCAGHAAERACLEGKSRCRTHCLAKQATPSLSRHLPLAAATGGDEFTTTSTGPSWLRRRKAPRRRRRGSRGGRSRHGAAGAASPPRSTATRA